MEDIKALRNDKTARKFLVNYFFNVKK